MWYGPPGGPAYQGEALVWKQLGDDATLHGVTVGGEFRLMPLQDGRYLLLFARNDYTVLVLATGERAELQRDAEDHLLDFRGDGLRVRLGDGKVDLHGLGVGSVVAYLELFHDARLVLGHLGGDTFGLFHMRGTEQTCLRLYSLAELRHGDLGCTLGWMFSKAESDAHMTAGAPPAERVPEAPRSAEPARAVPQPGRRTSRRTRQLEPDELQVLHRHLECTDASGPGATVMPRIFEGLRVLIELGEGDHLLRASDLQQFLATRARVRIHCCSKTLARSLAAAAARTRLLQRDGRRWRLRLGELLLEGSELFASIKAELAPSSQARTEEMDEVAGRPASSSIDAAHVRVREATTVPEPEATQPATERRKAAPEPGPSHQPRPRTDDPPFLWSSRRSRLPDEEAASRWSGRKPRGPPNR